MMYGEFMIRFLVLMVLVVPSTSWAKATAAESRTWDSSRSATQVLSILNDVTNWCHNCRYRLENIISQRVVQSSDTQMSVWTSVDQTGSPKYFTRRSWRTDAQGIIRLTVTLVSTEDSAGLAARSHLESDPGRILEMRHTFEISPAEGGGSKVVARLSTAVEVAGILEGRATSTMRENLRNTLAAQERYTSN